MAESRPAILPGEPTRHVVTRDVQEGRVQLESDVAIHICPSCSTELDDRYHFDCPECGHPSRPKSSCRSCGGPLVDELIRYTAEGPHGGAVLRLLPGVSCASCGSVGIEEHELGELDRLAALSDSKIEILPESGIVSAERLEVLADADVCGPGEPDEIVKRRDGMTLRLGAPSPLFEAALPVVTAHDPRDIFSPTLSLEPGPPYTSVQRRTFQWLLADVQRELGAPVNCWSASVGLSEEPLIDPVLTEQLMNWPEDLDGSALALYHAVTSGRAPGRFLGSVRLLARVLGRAGDADLAEALRARVQRLDPPPKQILQQLWLAMLPGHPFEEERVYHSMQAFHERYAAAPAHRTVPLPWEEPDYDGYAAWLRRLISAILADATPG